MKLLTKFAGRLVSFTNESLVWVPDLRVGVVGVHTAEPIPMPDFSVEPLSPALRKYLDVASGLDWPQLRALISNRTWAPTGIEALGHRQIRFPFEIDDRSSSNMAAAWTGAVFAIPSNGLPHFHQLDVRLNLPWQEADDPEDRSRQLVGTERPGVFYGPTDVLDQRHGA